MIFPRRKLSRWKYKRKGYKKCPAGRTVFWALWLWCGSCCALRSYEINDNNSPRYSFSSYLESAHSSHSSHHQAVVTVLGKQSERCWSACMCECACMCVGMYSKPIPALIPVLARSLCSHGAHLHIYFSTWWILSIFSQLFPPHMNISYTDFSLCPGDL